MTEPEPPRQGTARDSWIAVAVATVVSALGLMFVLVAFNEVQAAADARLEDVGSAPLYFLVGSGIMSLSFLFAAWKSRRDRWLMWALVAAFLNMASIVFLGLLGPVVALPTGAAVSLRIDGSRYVRARVFAVIMFVAAFVAAVPIGIMALLVLTVFPFLAIGLADRYIDRRTALRPAA